MAVPDQKLFRRFEQALVYRASAVDLRSCERSRISSDWKRRCGETGHEGQEFSPPAVDTTLFTLPDARSVRRIVAIEEPTAMRLLEIMDILA